MRVMIKLLKLQSEFMKKYRTQIIIVLILAFFVIVLNALNIYINV
jgi:hypothetical protein